MALKQTWNFFVRNVNGDFRVRLLLLLEDAAKHVDGHLPDVDGVVDQVLDQDGGHLAREGVVAPCEETNHGHPEVVVAPVQLT